HKVLGATVMMDAVVILIFAVAVSIAAVLVEGSSFEISFIVLVILEIVLDICLGIFIGYLLDKIMRIPSRLVKNVLILLIGLAIFLVSDLLHGFHLFSLPVAFFSEPLLISMVAGFYVTNYSRYAAGFRHQLEEMSPAIFLLFFSLVGIELELDILSQIWVIVLVLFFVRVFAIFAGTIDATTLTGDKSPGNKLLGLGFITQAGVSIGLAKEIGVEFEHWGQDLATLLIGVIVVNQIVGPPLMKWVINHVGESHTKADAPDFDGTRDVVIFGVETQSLALSRQLKSNGWNVVLVTCHEEARTNLKEASP
ncbi:MAG: cation:proton antiporter, partial [Methylococcales bacterium]|nr:cation:proton antiporter [Methylococcales bacterium]